jgi:hypothetical protein
MKVAIEYAYVSRFRGMSTESNGRMEQMLDFALARTKTIEV